MNMAKSTDKKNQQKIHQAIKASIDALQKSEDDIPQNLFSQLNEFTNGYFICFLDAKRRLQTRFEATSDGDAVSLVSHVYRYGNYMYDMQNNIFEQNMQGNTEKDGNEDTTAK